MKRRHGKGFDHQNPFSESYLSRVLYPSTNYESKDINGMKNLLEREDQMEFNEDLLHDQFGIEEIACSASCYCEIENGRRWNGMWVGAGALLVGSVLLYLGARGYGSYMGSVYVEKMEKLCQEKYESMCDSGLVYTGAVECSNPDHKPNISPDLVDVEFLSTTCGGSCVTRVPVNEEEIEEIEKVSDSNEEDVEEKASHPQNTDESNTDKCKIHNYRRTLTKRDYNEYGHLVPDPFEDPNGWRNIFRTSLHEFCKKKNAEDGSVCYGGEEDEANVYCIKNDELKRFIKTRDNILKEEAEKLKESGNFIEIRKKKEGESPEDILEDVKKKMKSKEKNKDNNIELKT